MKNFRTPLLAALALLPLSCQVPDWAFASTTSEPEEENTPRADLSLAEVARIFACLPIGREQMEEVHDAAVNSIGNGYDEEYTLKNLMSSPGTGVGGDGTKAGKKYSVPMRSLLEDFFGCTKAGAGDAQAYLDFLSECDMQIYWPFSENWDGEQTPVITFNPGDGPETNIGYCVKLENGSYRIADSLIVDEAYARTHPVWVINNNKDSAYTPLLQMNPPEKTKAPYIRKLILHDFTMLRNYDSWFEGGSEFWIKVGAVNGFSASTEAELKLYSPEVTDFMILVRRHNVGKPQIYDSIILTDFTNQMENLAFLVTEDDGGTRTSWKCSASVKIKSKSYGFDVDIPLNEKDDIVWRGQLSSTFFQSEDYVTGRFGDVVITFTLQ